MEPIHFAPLKQAYPFVNLATGPANQCAMRISRAIRDAYPEFFDEMLKFGDQLHSWNPPARHRHSRHPHHAHRLPEHPPAGVASALTEPASAEPAFTSSQTRPVAILRPMGPPAMPHLVPRVFSNMESQGHLFRFAQDVADVLRLEHAYSRRWIIPDAKIARTPAEIIYLRTHLNQSRQNGIVFFLNCFTPDALVPANQMAEDRHRDGLGDHVDLFVADSHHRNAPQGSAHHATEIGAHLTPHHTYLWGPEAGRPSGRADEVWFWPLPL